MIENKFVWVLEDITSVSVFIGFDHIRRSSKTYTSWNKDKMFHLAEKMAIENSLEVAIENKPMRTSLI